MLRKGWFSRQPLLHRGSILVGLEAAQAFTLRALVAAESRLILCSVVVQTERLILSLVDGRLVALAMTACSPSEEAYNPHQQYADLWVYRSLSCIRVWPELY